MLPLIKRSDAAQISAPNWHPNFRNFERLPDTKVVRTTFFLNAIAITVAACMLLLLGYRLYNLHDLNSQLDEAQALIDKHSKDNAEGLRLTKVFETEGAKVNEAVNFVRRQVVPSDFIQFLGGSLPKEVQIESVDMRFSGASGDQCILRGLVAGSKDEASGAATRYVELLRTVGGNDAKIGTVEISAINPDPAGAYLRFEILIKFKNPAKK